MINKKAVRVSYSLFTLTFSYFSNLIVSTGVLE